MSDLVTPDGTRLRVADRGRGPSTFVLVHGWKGSHRIWDHVLARLTDRHRCVAFDLRGMGESDKPDGAYDFDTLAGDLAHVLEALDVRDATLVGWSMGCTVSLTYLDGPRHDGRVVRAVLVNGPVRLTRAADFPHAMTDEQLGAYLDDLAAGWPASERAFQAQTLHHPDEATIDWLQSIALQTPLDVALRVVRRQAELDMRGAVARLRVPVLAAYGRHDPYYDPSLGSWIAETAPDGRCEVFEDSGHLPQLEEPAAFCAALEAFAAGRR